jgi:hypothetical protein
MLRKIGFSLLFAGVLFSTNSMAINHELAPGVSIEYELATNKPELFINYTIFTIKAVCTIVTPDESDLLHVKGVSRSGEINGQVINANDELDLIVKNGDLLYLTAKSAAKVEMTNRGEHTIRALCKTI